MIFEIHAHHIIIMTSSRLDYYLKDYQDKLVNRVHFLYTKKNEFIYKEYNYSLYKKIFQYMLKLSDQFFFFFKCTNKF
jgi:hypothetical protein